MMLWTFAFFFQSIDYLFGGEVGERLVTVFAFVNLSLHSLTLSSVTFFFERSMYPIWWDSSNSGSEIT